MKTAMQETVELVKKYDSREISYNVLLGNLELLLEKEKEQIADAFRNGSTSSMLGGGHWTQYYNQTYNQEETLEEWKSKFTHHCVIKANQNK
jgi:hypothetical protein